MLRRFSLAGAIGLTLSAVIACGGSVHATENSTASSITISTRPSQAELQLAINRLEQLGDYQTYFGPNSNATLSPQVPHYQEYLYLYQLISSTQLLVQHYNDAAYIAQHHITDQTFQDALVEMQHAYRGCNLLFNAQAKLAAQASTKPAETNSPSNEVAGTANNTSKSNTTVTSASVSNTQSAQRNSTNIAASANATVSLNNTPATDHTDDGSTNHANDATDAGAVDENHDIAVPATGEAAGTAGLAARRVSWPALIAVVVTGALVASIAIAIIIRHEPRRQPNRARRRH